MKQGCKRKINGELLADARKESHRCQRMTAEPEKVILSCNRINTEKFTPRLGNHALHRVEIRIALTIAAARFAP